MPRPRHARPSSLIPQMPVPPRRMSATGVMFLVSVALAAQACSGSSGEVEADAGAPEDNTGDTNPVIDAGAEIPRGADLQTPGLGGAGGASAPEPSPIGGTGGALTEPPVGLGGITATIPAEATSDDIAASCAAQSTQLCDTAIDEGMFPGEERDACLQDVFDVCSCFLLADATCDTRQRCGQLDDAGPGGNPGSDPGAALATCKQEERFWCENLVFVPGFISECIQQVNTWACTELETARAAGNIYPEACRDSRIPYGLPFFVRVSDAQALCEQSSSELCTQRVTCDPAVDTLTEEDIDDGAVENAILQCRANLVNAEGCLFQDPLDDAVAVQVQQCTEAVADATCAQIFPPEGVPTFTETSSNLTLPEACSPSDAPSDGDAGAPPEMPEMPEVMGEEAPTPGAGTGTDGRQAGFAPGKLDPSRVMERIAPHHRLMNQTGKPRASDFAPLFRAIKKEVDPQSLWRAPVSVPSFSRPNTTSLQP